MVGLDVRAPRRTPAPVDERAARTELRRQIAALELALSDALISAFPCDRLETVARAPGGPRMLNLGELEHLRDELVSRLAVARAEMHERGERQASCRALLERMRRAPGRHRFVRLANRALGEGGCGVWQVRPRLGLIGMLMGWWQVKLSSGCPLAS